MEPVPPPRQPYPLSLTFIPVFFLRLRSFRDLDLENFVGKWSGSDDSLNTSSLYLSISSLLLSRYISTLSFIQSVDRPLSYLYALLNSLEGHIYHNVLPQYWSYH